MKEIDFKTYQILYVEGLIAYSKIPKMVLKSIQFQNLIQAAILEKERVGRGLNIIVRKKELFKSFYKNTFPEQTISETSKASNIKKFRDSKAKSINTPPIFFIRGFSSVIVNDRSIDLNYYTKNFGLFSVQSPNIACNEICFIENLDTFLKAEVLLGNGYVFVHKYGRIGIDSIKSIKANDVLVFVDYDFNGMDEYIRIRSIFPNAKLYIPDEFETLSNKYSKFVSGKQKMSKSVKESKLPEVIQVRNYFIKNNRFLEQEVLIDV
jgi:5S rRNA maturation endonuclease (ribonuclease M5)